MSFLRNILAPRRVALEDQLATMARCGIRLRSEFSVDTLLEFFDREKYETNPYYGVTITMGGQSKHEPYAPLSDNVWHLDAECIADPGDYAYIAERMRDLAQGELPIENICDRVDHENGDAWVEFELSGETIHWGARVHEKWIDPEMISHFCELLSKQNGTRRYTFFDLKGPSSLIGCATEEELQKLRKETGLRFTWLG